MIDSVKIGGITYAITRDATLPDTGFAGQIRHHRCQIVIADNLHPVAAQQVLWHEIVHGIMQHAGIAEQPESLVEAISYGVTQVLRDNPGILDA